MPLANSEECNVRDCKLFAEIQTCIQPKPKWKEIIHKYIFTILMIKYRVSIFRREVFSILSIPGEVTCAGKS